MRILVTALLAMAIASHACPTLRTNIITPTTGSPFVPDTRFFSRADGMVKCAEQDGNGQCHFRMPYTFFVEVEMNEDIPEGANKYCAVGFGLEPPMLVDTPQTQLSDSQKMRLDGVNNVQAEYVLWDVLSGVRLATLPFELNKHPATKSYLSSLYTGSANNITQWMYGGYGPAGPFLRSNYTIFNVAQQVAFLRVSSILSYTPLHQGTNEPLTLDECSGFENELFQACDKPGFYDFKYEDELRESYSISVNPFPVWAASGAINEQGDGEANGSPYKVAWVDNNEMRGFGKCTNVSAASTECGDYQYCDQTTVEDECVQCIANSECSPKYQQVGHIARCTVNAGQGMCEYAPMNVSVAAPVSPTPPPQECNPVCALQYCDSNICQACRKDSDCDLPFTLKDGYTGTCDKSDADSFVCHYDVIFPDKTKIEDKTNTVLIISGAAIGAIICCGLCLGGLFVYKRKQKEIEADNLMGDKLAKKKPKGNSFGVGFGSSD